MFRSRKVKSSKSSKPSKSKTQSQSYRDLGFNGDIDITEGDPVNDHRVIQLQREIKQLKERVEAQAELTRQLEDDKNKLQSQLDSYRKRCSDLQQNLDDKDQHLNEVVSQLTSSYAQHSKPMATKQKKSSSKWFGWGSPRSTPKGPNSSHENLFSTPQHTPQHHRGLESHSSMSPNDEYPIPGGGGGINDSPLNDNIVSDDYMASLPNINIHNTLPCMTAPIGSLPSTTRPRRSGSVHIISTPNNETEGSWNGYTGDGTNSLIGMERNEMEFKIKNSSRDKLRNYVRDLFSSYNDMSAQKDQLFHDLAKATHGQGWAQKQAIEKKKEAKSARAKEINAQNHIRSLEKSISKERKKLDKYKNLFQDFKQNAIKKRKDLLIDKKKLQNIIDLKDEFIARACYKLILYKDRLSQFEIPVFQEYVILIAPTKEVLMKYDGEQVNGPGVNDSSTNLNVLHENMVNHQTPGGPGMIPMDGDVNSNGGTVTSIASVDSTASADGFKKTSLSSSTQKQHRKSSSRKGSAASQSNNNAPDIDGGEEKSYIIDEENENDIVDMNAAAAHKKKKKKKKKKNKRSKSSNNVDDDEDDNKDQININISAKPKKKSSSRNKLGKHLKTKSSSKQPSISNLSRAVNKRKSSKEKTEKKRLREEEKAKKRKEKNKKLIEENAEINEDYLDMDIEEMMSSSSSSEDDDSYILLSDSEEMNKLQQQPQPHDNSGILYDRDGYSNSLINYVELKLVKYPGTGELYMVLNGQDDKKDQIELFRTDFANCINIDKNKIESDFTIYFENIHIIFRADDYEKTRRILINLRQFFETHSNNIQPELPPPPETTVTNQMNLFFGGGF